MNSRSGFRADGKTLYLRGSEITTGFRQWLQEHSYLSRQECNIVLSTAPAQSLGFGETLASIQSRSCLIVICFIPPNSFLGHADARQPVTNAALVG